MEALLTRKKPASVFDRNLASIHGRDPRNRASGFELLLWCKEIHRRICIESLGAETKLRGFKLTCAILICIRFKKRICLLFFKSMGERDQFGSWKSEPHCVIDAMTLPSKTNVAVALSDFFFFLYTCLSYLTQQEINFITEIKSFGSLKSRMPRKKDFLDYFLYCDGLRSGT